jgi:hypothetical protein
VRHRTLRLARFFAWRECPQYSHRSFGGIGEGVGDEGVVTRLAETHLEDAAPAYRDIHGLDPSQRARLRPILENALEDSAHHVERANPVRPGIDDIEPQQLVGGDVDGMGRVLTRPPIEDDVVGRQTQEPFPVEPPGSVRRRLGRQIELAFERRSSSRALGRGTTGSTISAPYIPLAMCIAAGAVPQWYMKAPGTRATKR